MTIECCLKVVYHLMNPSKHDQKDSEGPLLLDFKSYNYTTSTNHYCQTALQKLCTNIKNKCSGKLSIILLVDNVHLYVSHSLRDQQNAMLCGGGGGCWWWTKHPAYSLYLFSHDFHVF